MSARACRLLVDEVTGEPIIGRNHKNKEKNIMNTILSTALIIVGVVLIVLGVVAMDSFGSDVSRFFTGAPTDKAVWMCIAGILALIAGGAGTGFRMRAA